MREAWRELMFADEQIELKASRDPVAPAQRSAAALQKVATHTLDDGRTAGAQLPHPAGESRHYRAQYLRTAPRNPWHPPSRSIPRLTAPNSGHFELLSDYRRVARQRAPQNTNNYHLSR